MNITLTVRSITKTQVGVVTEVSWLAEGQDENGDIGYYYGVTKAGPPTENFVAYDDLTEEIVLDWVQSAPDYASLLETVIPQTIRVDIENRKIEVVPRQYLPWMTVEPSPAIPVYTANTDPLISKIVNNTDEVID